MGRGLLAIIVLVLIFFGSVFALQRPPGFKRGGWLDIAQPDDADILDPARTVYDMAVRVNALIYEPLLTWDYDMNLRPLLAESWEYNEVGRFYEFKLRRGIKFHCGREFNADAVVYSLNRLKTIPGSKHAESVAHISVEKKDDYTVRIYLDKDDRYILEWFASPSSAIVCPYHAEQYGIAFGTPEGPPCGTGPFKFKHWEPKRKIELERYEGYTWGPSHYSNRGPAYLEGITFHVIRTDATREERLERGDIDFVTTVRKSEDLIKRWKADPNIELIAQPGSSLVYLGFNCYGTEDHGYGDTPAPKSVPKKVRQAIAYAINENEIIEVALKGMAVPPKSWLADAIWGSVGYQEELYPYDPDKARQLLAEAGYADGYKLEVLTTAYDEYVNVLLVLQQQLAEVGIDMSITQLEFTVLEERIKNKDYGAFIMGYTWPLADILWWEFHTVRLPSPNRFWWGDENTDPVFEATFSMDDDEALAAVKEAQRLIAEDAASLALYQRMIMLAYRSDYVKGYRLHPQGDKAWHFLDTYIVLEEPYAVSVSVLPENQVGSAGDTLTYTVTLVNIGTEDDTYSLTVSDNAGWELQLENQTVSVLSGESVSLSLTVTIPPDAPSGATNEIIIEAVSMTEAEVRASDSCFATVS
jgi:peptide/nickel transport system substrate-binding protein